jgi:hypothetical protein
VRLGFLSAADEMLRQEIAGSALAEHHAAMQRKNRFFAGLYLLSIPLAHISIYASFLVFVLILAMYFLPEKKLAAPGPN